MWAGSHWIVQLPKPEPTCQKSSFTTMYIYACGGELLFSYPPQAKRYNVNGLSSHQQKNGPILLLRFATGHLHVIHLSLKNLWPADHHLTVPAFSIVAHIWYWAEILRAHNCHEPLLQLFSKMLLVLFIAFPLKLFLSCAWPVQSPVLVLYGYCWPY